MRARIVLAAVMLLGGGTRADDMSDPSRVAQLAASVHHALACEACHREHGDPVAACAGCHGHEAGAVAGGGHAAKPSCVDCHGSHDVRGKRDPSSRSSIFAVVALCGGCHTAEMAALQRGAHAARGNALPASCVSCHDAHAAQRPAPFACGACHARELADWSASRHAAAQPPIACGGCHRAHDEPAGLAAGGARTAAGGIARCTPCHRAQAADFTRSLHGKAFALGDPRAPACTTCHTSHAIRSSREPDASTSEQRRGETCGRCHTSAAPGFAAGAMHDDGRGGHRVVALVRVMYTMMIVLVIALMLLHNALDVRRRLADHKRHRGAREAATVPRFTGFERIQHWLLVASFVTLAVTGFSLALGLRPIGFDPAAWTITRAWLHRGAAVLFVALALVHVIWLVTTRRGRMNLAALRPRVRSAKDVACIVCACMRLGPPTAADWRAMLETVRYNLGRRDTRPAQGRFTYAEKMEYFALVWGGIVMTATGLALWLAGPLLSRAPFWVASLADVIHLFEATLAALAIVVWHFYFVILRPEVFPLSRAMLTGKIPEREAREEHALEGDASGAPQAPEAEGDARTDE